MDEPSQVIPSLRETNKHKKMMQFIWVIKVYSLLLTSLEILGELHTWIVLLTCSRPHQALGKSWPGQTWKFQSGWSLLQDMYRQHLGACSLCESTVDLFPFHLCRSLPKSHSLRTQALIQNMHKGEPKVTKCSQKKANTHLDNSLSLVHKW